MNTNADKTLENKSQAVANSVPKLQSSGEAFPFVDNRPEASTQRKLQAAINNSPGVKQLRAYQEIANNKSLTKLPPIQRMKYSTGVHITFEQQTTNMSCWAACIAAVTGIPQSDIITKYSSEAYEINGLPEKKDWSVMINDYGLMKVTPWNHAVTFLSMVAMIALPDHWVVSYGLETSDDDGKMTNILFFDPWDGKTYNEDLVTFSKRNPSVAYRKA